MNFSGSVTDFFYNIVPGSLFLFLCKYFKFDIIEGLGINQSDSALLLFVYVILGLLLGFLFQSCTKFIRKELGGNERMALKIKSQNEKEFKIIYTNLYKNLGYDKNNLPPLTKTFHLMDVALRTKSPAFLPTHFSSRFAFWTNIFFSLCTITLIRIYFHQSFDMHYIFLLLGIGWTLWCSNESFEGFYDSVLKGYFMEIKNAPK